MNITKSRRFAIKLQYNNAEKESGDVENAQQATNIIVYVAQILYVCM